MGVATPLAIGLLLVALDLLCSTGQTACLATRKLATFALDGLEGGKRRARGRALVGRVGVGAVLRGALDATGVHVLGVRAVGGVGETGSHGRTR